MFVCRLRANLHKCWRNLIRESGSSWRGNTSCCKSGSSRSRGMAAWFARCICCNFSLLTWLVASWRPVGYVQSRKLNMPGRWSSCTSIHSYSRVTIKIRSSKLRRCCTWRTQSQLELLNEESRSTLRFLSPFASSHASTGISDTYPSRTWFRQGPIACYPRHGHLYPAYDWRHGGKTHV